MIKYTYLIEVETHESLDTKELSEIKKFLENLQAYKIETEYCEVTMFNTKVKYLGERY